MNSKKEDKMLENFVKVADMPQEVIEKIQGSSTS